MIMMERWLKTFAGQMVTIGTFFSIVITVVSAVTVTFAKKISEETKREMQIGLERNRFHINVLLELYKLEHPEEYRKACRRALAYNEYGSCPE